MHASDAIVNDGAYRGRGVHVAAPIASAAAANEILVGKECLDEDPGRTTTNHRSLQLQGLADRIELVSLRWDE